MSKISSHGITFRTSGWIHEDEVVVSVTEKILGVFAESFRIQSREYYISASIGISRYPDDGVDSATLIKNADAAMYSAKDRGKHRYHFYTSALTEKIRERVSFETASRSALINDEFYIEYQPIINVKNHSLCCLEALLRWNSADIGLISPARFIPELEESGLIVDVGNWLFSEVCQFIYRLRKELSMPVKASINISVKQLSSNTLVENIRKSIKKFKVEPGALELEITESALLVEESRIYRTLDEIKREGITLSLDDFGTGYSSLSYLKKYPFDKLKVDRSFVSDLVTDPEDLALTHAIIAMAHALNLKVVAEGVETENQKNMLDEMGCEIMQGYLYSKPLPSKDVARWAKSFYPGNTGIC